MCNEKNNIICVQNTNWQKLIKIPKNKIKMKNVPKNAKNVNKNFKC